MSFVPRLGWAVSYVQTLGEVVVADSKSIVIEAQGRGHPIQFVLKNQDSGVFSGSLKKGDRLRVWYSLELKKVDRIDQQSETRILLPLEEVVPVFRLRSEDRGIFAA